MQSITTVQKIANLNSYADEPHLKKLYTCHQRLSLLGLKDGSQKLLKEFTLRVLDSGKNLKIFITHLAHLPSPYLKTSSKESLIHFLEKLISDLEELFEIYSPISEEGIKSTSQALETLKSYLDNLQKHSFA